MSDNKLLTEFITVGHNDIANDYNQLKRDYEVALKMIDLLESIKSKLERKVCILMKNCKCKASTENNTFLKSTNKQLANLYNEYVHVMRDRHFNHVIGDGDNQTNDLEESVNDANESADVIRPQVILNVEEDDFNVEESAVIWQQNHAFGSGDIANYSNESSCSSEIQQNIHQTYKIKIENNHHLIPKDQPNFHFNQTSELVSTTQVNRLPSVLRRCNLRRVTSCNSHHVAPCNSHRVASCNPHRVAPCNSHRVAPCNKEEAQPKFKCDFANCDSYFKRLPDLVKHKKIHSIEKPYKCTWEGCNYSAAQKFSLTFHLRLHTGEKPYKCDWPGCDYRSRHSYSMVHHKRGHTGEKKYKCDFPGCTYQARMLTDFKRHTSKHTGIQVYAYHKMTDKERESNAFKCEYPGCNMKCKSLGYLKSHLRRKHNIDN